MKTKLIISATTVVILSTAITIAALCTSLRPISSDVFLFNIEALSQSESSYSCTVRVDCWIGGGFVECSGTKCSRTGYSVTCDGNTTEC